MQVQADGGQARAPSSLSTLYGGLSDFSSLLTSALGTIDSNVSSLQSSNSNNQEQIEALKAQVEKYGIKLRTLEAEAAEQREKVERAMLNVTDMGKNIDTQLSETTKQMHRELLSQRTATKMDLFTLGGNIRKSMNEAMDLIAESPKLLKSSGSAAYNPNSTNEEGIKYLLEKIKVIEEALMIQHNVNMQLSESVKNDEMVRKVYDSLYDQISQLETSLLQANLQNQELREKNNRDLEKMRETQAAQQDQISQLIGALLSTKNMKKFKQTMSRIAEADVEDAEGFVPSKQAVARPPPVSTKPPTPTAAAKAATPTAAAGASAGAGEDSTAAAVEEEKEEVQSGDEGSEEEEERRPRKHSRNKRRRHRRRHSDSESDEEEDPEEGGDRFDERGESRHATVKTRHHHHHHHHRTTVKETVVVKETVTAPASAPAASGGDEVNRTESTSSKNRPTEIRRNKTFNSGSGKHDKEVQTPKAASASISTNTDKPKTPPASATITTPAPTAPAPLPKQADGKIIFDDEGSIATGEHKAEMGEPVPRTRSADSLDESYSYYDSDSYYSVSVRGAVSSEQLEQVAAQAKQQVEDLRTEYQKRVAELEESVLTFKRIALMLEDMKINYDLLKAKVDNVSGNATGAAGNFDEMRATSQYHSIQHAKMLWSKVHAELLFGLEKFSEHDSDIDGDSQQSANVSETTRNSRLFMKKASALVGFLDANLAAFHPAETVAATLKTVHPTLEQIYKQGMELDALDEVVRNSPGLEETCNFDTLWCSDETHNLRNFLRDAMAASVPVLDESIPKVAMRQRLEALERQMRDKVDKATLKATQDEMKNIAKAKVDVKEFQATVSKLATAAELAKLNLYVADIGGRGSGAGYSNQRSDATVDLDRAELTRNPDFQSLLQRFDMLGKQQLDLHNFCATFVPREEVHEAMKAVIAEVKQLKQNTVNHALFRDGLKTKADTAEVEKVVKAITEAVGDLNINSSDAAAAVHAKCLICDKPVTAAQRARTAAGGAGSKSRSMVSSSMPLLGYSKAMDDSSVNSVEHERHMFNRLTSNNPAVSQNERVKVATELAILRSSIDPLPEINDPSNSQSESTPGQSAGHYKQRIRHSAGGGVGPNYKKDTR